MNDADIEMAELEYAANREARLRRKGICAHGAYQGPPGPPNKPTSVFTCFDCGKVFQTEEELHEERQEILA